MLHFVVALNSQDEESFSSFTPTLKVILRRPPEIVGDDVTPSSRQVYESYQQQPLSAKELYSVQNCSVTAGSSIVEPQSNVSLHACAA